METIPGAIGQSVPNVVIKPPMLFLVFLFVGSMVNYFFPLATFDFYLQFGLGSLLLIDAMVLLVLAMRRFKSARTPVSVEQSSRTLVQSGIYTRSRNPIYLGMLLGYTGLALLASNAWLLVLLPLLVAALYTMVIFPEERYLQQQFGDQYSKYRKTVRRWL